MPLCLKGVIMIVMHTTCHREFGGLEKRIYNESCKIAEKGYTIIIAAPDNTPLMTKCRDKGFRCFPVEFTAKSCLKDYFALQQIFRKFKPDVLNTHGNTDSKIALTAACGIQMKYSIPCTILSRHISAEVKPSWYNRLLYNKLCKYIFTTADYTTKHLISSLSIAPDRIFTLPSGILPPADLPDKEVARSVLVKELIALNPECKIHIDSDSRFIGFVGRVSEDKGIVCIIKAFLLISNLIAKKTPNYHLVIVGQGDIQFTNRLKAMIHQTRYKDFIHLTGFKENTWPYYRAFDCNILASKEVEGISQSLLEAMYAKCPVAGSKIGGTCDIIRDGETGLLFKPDDIEGIANCILDIINDKDSTKKRVEAAFQMVKNRYTIDSMINQILTVYSNHHF